ncbi:hypothetical protein CEXT_550981 [Caerostris extrusa]|uniref:Uncharacterized protein n=1 Tax=Caerostris extrusa TaxID=172846 RepID=A0AAV4NKM5_CAEEX|nr:hypothetical protein CEXT_550981 [Caerostris extrusa]
MSVPRLTFCVDISGCLPLFLYKDIHCSQIDTTFEYSEYWSVPYLIKEYTRRTSAVSQKECPGFGPMTHLGSLQVTSRVAERNLHATDSWMGEPSMI